MDKYTKMEPEFTPTDALVGFVKFVAGACCVVLMIAATCKIVTLLVG